MADKNRTLDTLHIHIHALRMQEKYQPTRFEWNMNKIISEAYASECEECKLKAEMLKYQQPPEKTGFLANLIGGKK